MSDIVQDHYTEDDFESLLDDAESNAAKVRARMQSGEALTWRDVWAMAPDASRTWAHDTLRKLRARPT